MSRFGEGRTAASQGRSHDRSRDRDAQGGPGLPAGGCQRGGGTLFFGAILGIGGNLLIAPAALPLWLVIVLLTVGVISAGACASGLTMKLMRR